MGGDDFSAYQQVAPGVYFMVGARSEEAGAMFPHHHPRFTIDERAMENAIAVFVETARELPRRRVTTATAAREAGPAGLGARHRRGRKLPGLSARSDDASGVRVAPPGAVVLGRDQHVLAHRVEPLTAERAAVGRGLQVLRAADRPPARVLRRHEQHCARVRSRA